MVIVPRATSSVVVRGILPSIVVPIGQVVALVIPLVATPGITYVAAIVVPTRGLIALVASGRIIGARGVVIAVLIVVPARRRV